MLVSEVNLQFSMNISSPTANGKIYSVLPNPIGMKGLKDGLFESSRVTKSPDVVMKSISYPFELYIGTISRGLDKEVEFLRISTLTIDPLATIALRSIPLVSFFTISFGALLYLTPPVIIPTDSIVRISLIPIIAGTLNDGERVGSVG